MAPRYSLAKRQAAELLRRARIRKAPIPVEKIAALLNAEIVLQPFSGETSGVVYRNKDGTAIIGVNSSHPIQRQRFTIAHEIGHHVQNQLGLMREVAQKSGNASEKTRNALSVRQELQADCFAGVWGHSAQQRGALDTRDIEQGLAAAASVGDDRLQQQARGYAVPESFTHGSSAQRVKWFRVGLATGDLRQCNTFASAGP